MFLDSRILFRVIWFVGCRIVAVLAVLTGLAASPAAIAGSPWSWVWEPGGVPLGIHLDVVGVVLLTFVGLLGWVVSRYSLTNLRGRDQFARSGAILFFALLGLCVTVSGASLVTVAIGWTFSGQAVVALISRAGTPEARQASSTMRVTLLIGDVFLWAGVILAACTLPSLDRTRMQEVQPGWTTTAIVALLLVACIARSCQVPAHRWLPETAEAPSPISALLHAGVVNGAGVLVVLFWPLFAAAPAMMAVLLAVGATTVAIGAWSSRMRSDVKGRLACSTTSQMGYMCVELGLGLPGAALLHVVGHGAYKSWLFLRAGGTAARTRTGRAPLVVTPSRVASAATLAGVLTLLIGLPAGYGLVHDGGVTALAPVVLAIFASALAGSAAAGLRRVSSRTIWAVCAVAGVVAGAYVWMLLGVEQLLSVVAPPQALWGPVIGSVLLVAVVAVAVAVSRGVTYLEANPDSALAVRLLRTALPPQLHLAQLRREQPRLDVSQLEQRAQQPQVDELTAVGAVVSASSVVGPAWPLRDFVAANPLVKLESMAFEDALQIAERAHGVTGRAGLDYFLDLHASARITDAHLRAALDAEALGDLASSVTDFVSESHQLAGLAQDPPRCETARLWESLWAQRGWPGTQDCDGPWLLWHRSAARPQYDRVVKVPGASAFARSLPTDPAAAIGYLLACLEIPTDQLVSYFVATFATTPGWTGHAAWRSRRAQHPGPLVELIALHLAHDVLFARNPPVFAPTAEVPRHYAKVWQRALEIGVQEQLLPTLVRDLPTSTDRPASQSIWCIDVRSEPVRRHLEALGDHDTFGFAGFFGAAVRYEDADGVGYDLCPGIVEPAFSAEQRPVPLSAREVLHRTVTAVSRHPLGALAIAEGGGLISAGASTLSVLDPQRMRRITRPWTQGPQRAPQLSSDLDLAGRVALAASALRAIGLTDNFAPVLVVCGHGASTENNAFATAYDCGACGGNDGVVNATLLVEALNDRRVRGALAAQGLRIPEDTVAVAALHDTTTDRVKILPHGALPVSAEMAVQRVAFDLHTASEQAGRNRRVSLPSRGARADAAPLGRRAADWSEPTPEWGLAGNASIVIGPRALTAGIDLEQRAFLHSYDRAQDPDGAVLEVLLTAPLVVAQWINAQYYFSAVAPDVFGAGDKTTHNTITDLGVICGAHGDLRGGLPWQALFRQQPGTAPDSGSLMHEPVRLLAVVAADPALIVDIVARHQTLSQLVCNEWIHLVCVDGEHTRELRSDLTWQPWRASPQDEPDKASVSG